MSRSIVYGVAASAATFGGPVVGALLFRRCHQEAAAEEQAREDELIRQQLQRQIDMAPLKDDARRHGVDPEQIQQRHRNTLAATEQIVPH